MLNEFDPRGDYGATELAMQGMEARYAGDNKLLVQFHVLPMIDDTRSAEEGRPIYKEVDHVRIMQPGNKESIVDRPVTEMDKARFQQQYERWKSGQAELVEGTPLEAWPEITRAQVEELRFFHVRTVEQLCDISDANAQKFMGINVLRKKARIYRDKANKNAASTKLQKQLEEKDNQIASLNAALKDLQAKVAGLENGVKFKPA